MGVTKRTFCAFLLRAAAGLGSPAAAVVGPAGPEKRVEVTQLLLDKSARKLYLLHGKQVVRSYSVNLESNPSGPKQYQGDGRTPEGLYVITHCIPIPMYSCRCGFPTQTTRDRVRARAMSRDLGGDIFIHERGARVQNPPRDWTLGCAAVTDREMAEIFFPGAPRHADPNQAVSPGKGRKGCNLLASERACLTDKSRSGLGGP